MLLKITRLKSNMILSLLLVFCNLLSAQKVSVGYNAKNQTINMIGSDLERSAGFVQSAANSEQVIKWAFEDIPYIACRVAYDKKQELVEGETNFSYYDEE